MFIGKEKPFVATAAVQGGSHKLKCSEETTPWQWSAQWCLVGCADAEGSLDMHWAKGSTVSLNTKHTKMGDSLKWWVFPWLKEVILHVISCNTNPTRYLLAECFSCLLFVSVLLLCVPPSIPAPVQSLPMGCSCSTGPPPHTIPACPPCPAMPKALQLLPACLGAFPGSAEQEELFSPGRNKNKLRHFQMQREGKAV